jgi:hypothetical protein
MMNVYKKFCWALGLLCVCAFSTFGQAPSGDFDFSFDADVTPVFDLTGDYTITDTILGAGDAGTPFSIGVHLDQDLKGRIRGADTAIMTIGNDSVAANYIARGRIYTGSDGTHVALAVRFFGEDIVAGIQTRFSITVTYKLLVSPTELTLFGTSRGKARFGFGSGTIGSDVEFPLAEGMNGTWTAHASIFALRRLIGSGNVMLSNGRVLPMKLSGSYFPSTGLAQINLSGIDFARGNSVSIRFASSTNGTSIERARGTLLGQKVRR